MTTEATMIRVMHGGMTVEVPLFPGMTQGQLGREVRAILGLNGGETLTEGGVAVDEEAPARADTLYQTEPARRGKNG